MARKSTTGKSTPQPSPLSSVLEKLVIPAIMAEQEPGGDGSPINRPDSESDDYPCVRGLLRGGWMVHVRPLPIDDNRTLLRLSLLSGYIISDCPSAVILLGNLLEPSPFQIRTHYQLGLIGEICIGCDLTVRTDDAPLVQRRMRELRQLADDLDGLLPLRVPHHLNWRCVRGLEIDWLDLPHQDLGGFLDEGMEAPRSERTPLTLLRIAHGLERWQYVLRLLREHTDELPAREFAPLKCLACHELQRWLPAIRAAKAGGIRHGRYPNEERICPAYTHALIQAGDAIESLRFLGKHQSGEPAYYDWLRGLAFHHAGDRKQAGASFKRHFAHWPCDIIGATEVGMLDAEE
jgi:hypothetical protein